MPQFLIERQIPGIERMTPEELSAVARKSNQALADLGAEIRWIQSYVVNGKTYCVYTAPDEELIHAHAQLTGFPCNVITRVENIIGPETAQLQRAPAPQA